MFEQRDFNFIYKYFIAEKQESLLFLIVGIAAIMLAIIFFIFIRSNPLFYKGAAIPLLAIGIVQCVVGFTVYSRSNKQMNEVAYNIGMEPVSYTRTQELPRMETVMKNFVIYRWVEIAFILIGVGLIFLFRTNPDRSFWYGLGITLAIQAFLMLGADFFAERRGGVYTEELENLVK
ncbi:MAG: hypothetical protein KTQ13_09890 [Ferruginibacter sp.]|nr:hypothetical protein [Ferruginibacter sp.]MBU9936952.1 hypothetical protein [Ferruginibacter sp.]